MLIAGIPFPAIAWEGTKSNLFARVDGVLRTAPRGPRILPGVTRDSVIQLAKSWGVKVSERRLAMDEVKPLDLEWVTRRMADKVPFLEYGDGLLVCDLTKVPRLANLFSCQVKGIKLADFLSLRELVVRDGEVVGRLGIVL